MPATTKHRLSRNSQAGNRRELILATTLRMIATGGIDSVTHRRVAESAGIPLGSTTYYFETREHLLRDTFDYYIDRAKQAQARLALNQADSVAALVKYLVEITNREFDDEALLLAEYEMTLFAARDAKLAESLHAWDRLMIKRIAEVMKSLGATKATDAARTILHLMRGYELERLSRHTPDPADLGRRLKVVVTAFIA